MTELILFRYSLPLLSDYWSITLLLPLRDEIIPTFTLSIEREVLPSSIRALTYVLTLIYMWTQPCCPSSLWLQRSGSSFVLEFTPLPKLLTHPLCILNSLALGLCWCHWGREKIEEAESGVGGGTEFNLESLSLRCLWVTYVEMSIRLLAVLQFRREVM